MSPSSIARRIEEEYTHLVSLRDPEGTEIGPNLRTLIFCIAQEIARTVDIGESMATLPAAPGRSESGDVR